MALWGQLTGPSISYVSIFTDTDPGRDLNIVLARCVNIAIGVIETSGGLLLAHITITIVSGYADALEGSLFNAKLAVGVYVAVVLDVTGYAMDSGGKVILRSSFLSLALDTVTVLNDSVATRADASLGVTNGF